MTIDVATFRPAGASVQIIATTAGVAPTAIYTSTNATGAFQGAPDYGTVRITASGTSNAIVNFGGTGASVTGTTGMLIATGVHGEKFGFASYTHIAAMAASGTSTVTVTYGGGL